MTITWRTVLLVWLATSLVACAASAPATRDDQAPPFPLSDRTQELAYRYLVCATRAFEKQYLGTVALDKAVSDALGHCVEAGNRAHDSIRQDAISAGCESCAPAVVEQMDREVRHKLRGDMNYEGQAERSIWRSLGNRPR